MKIVNLDSGFVSFEGPLVEPARSIGRGVSVALVPGPVAFVPSAPAAFGLADWSLSTGLATGQVVLNIAALPADGGSAITAIQYNIGAGWVAISGVGTGPRTLAMATPNADYTFALRAINALGAGASSATKTVTSAAETAPTAPAAFATTDWSIATGPAANQVVITISNLPSDGGSAITALQYSNGGTWTNLSGTGVGDYVLDMPAASTEYSIRVRTRNAIGISGPGVTKTVLSGAAAPTAPSPFAAGDWSLATGLEANQLVVNIASLPANGGSPITAIQYSANNGTWTPLTGAGTGAHTLTMPAAATSYSIRLRAVNAVGNSTPGDTKTATSGAEGAPALAATALWVGAVTNDTLMVSAYAEQGAATMQAFALPVGGGAEIAGPTVAVSTIEAVLPAELYPSTNYGVARCTITGLSPDREYDIGVRIDGQVTPGMTGWAKTRPAVRKPFTFGFGTCFEMNTSRNYLNFDTMSAQDLDFFAVLDDRGYSDITVNDFRRYYRADWGYLHHPKIGPFHRAFPIYNVPGDHDFGADNSNAGSAGKPGFMQWYRNHAPQPVTLTGALDPVDYAVWIAPGLKLVMADTRTNRSGVMFMDAAQEARLIAHIQEVGAIPDAAMIWNSGTPWISTSADMDTWAGATAQRQRIADAVLQYAPGRVAIICGDMHALAFDDGTNSAGGMPVFHAAPMARANSSKGGPYTGGAPIIASQTQYGQMDCTPVTGGWQLAFRGYSVDATGVQTVALTGAATLVAPAAPVQEAPVFTGASAITGGDTAGSILTASPGAFTGQPTPTVAYQWRLDGVDVPGQTAATYTRPATVGAVPSVRITLSNGVGSPAVRTIAAAATQAGAAPGYFSDFSEFSAGAVVSPWAERASTAARPTSTRFVFAQVGGTMALTAPGSVANDSAVALAGLTPGQSLRTFMQAETSYNGSSSLEWHIYSTASEIFYRFDLNPVGDVLRLRKFTGVANGFDALTQVTVPQDILPNVRVNILTEIAAGVLRCKVWNVGASEPVDWQLIHTDPTPVPAPYIAGVGCAANRPQPTIRQIGVGIDGATAPRTAV